MTPKQITILIAAGLLLVLALAMGSDLLLFINPAGLLLVVGGTLAGVFLAFPLETLRELWAELRSLGRSRVMGLDRLIAVFVELARLQRRAGARTLERRARALGNPFLALGVSLVVDELPWQEVKQRLEQEFDFFLSRREAQRGVLSLMGRLAPALGLAGTMIGLIRMLHGIKDPAAVTQGMSVALLTTFYGLMLANLLILPLERKLNERTRGEAVEMTLIIEGVMGLCLEENGAAMEARLNSFRQACAGSSPAGAKAGVELARRLAGLKLARPLARSGKP